MKIRLSLEEEVTALTKFSKDAFDTDIYVGGKDIGGPPDYDNVSWHRQMLKEKHLYSVLVQNQLIGGAVLFLDMKSPETMYVGRIFIDPELHRKGYGKEMMCLLENMFPDILNWILETPIWNIRTNSFYQKLGFKETYRDADSVYYNKRKQDDNV